jgi:hypothetical protein
MSKTSSSSSSSTSIPLFNHHYENPSVNTTKNEFKVDDEYLLQYNPQEEYHSIMDNVCDIWWEHRLKNYDYAPPWIQIPIKILQLQEEEINRSKTFKYIHKFS